jgi:hypothetical protein
MSTTKKKLVDDCMLEFERREIFIAQYAHVCNTTKLFKKVSR